MQLFLWQRAAKPIAEFVMGWPSFYVDAGLMRLLTLHFFVGQKIAVAVLDKMRAGFKKIKADVLRLTFPA